MRYRLHARGFSLVEVLVAMVITAIGISGNYVLFARTTQQNQQGIHTMRASRLAISAYDLLRVNGGLDNTLVLRCDNGDNSACERYLQRNAAIEHLRHIAREDLPQGQFELRRHSATHWQLIVQWQESLSLQPMQHSVRVHAQ